MSNEKWTQGPWERVGTEIWAGSTRIVMGRGAHDEKDRAIQKANAQLISTTPELYRQLDNTAKHYCYDRCSHRPDTIVHDRQCLENKIVLARARGES